MIYPERCAACGADLTKAGSLCEYGWVGARWDGCVEPSLGGEFEPDGEGDMDWNVVKVEYAECTGCHSAVEAMDAAGAGKSVREVL